VEEGPETYTVEVTAKAPPEGELATVNFREFLFHALR